MIYILFLLKYNFKHWLRLHAPDIQQGRKEKFYPKEGRE